METVLILKEEKAFESIKKGDTVEIVLNDRESTHVSGKLFDNNLKKMHVIDQASEDTIVRYEQIKFVEIFA